MLDYNEELNSSGTYSSCVPYWTDGTRIVVGDIQDSYGLTMSGRNECVPLDVSDKFQAKPTKAQVEAMGRSVMSDQNPTVPTQTIHVEFVRLQDVGYENYEKLLTCKLCDTIEVVFPFYETTARFQIVKTVWNVLEDRYDSMELGDLSVTLAEALGITSSDRQNVSDNVITTLVTKTLSNGISANNYVAAADIAMTPQDGYKAVGIVGWSTTNWRIRPTTNYIKDDSTIFAGFSNDTATAVSGSVTIIFRVLWVK